VFFLASSCLFAGTALAQDLDRFVNDEVPGLVQTYQEIHAMTSVAIALLQPQGLH
jgi:hypothetical protein